MAKGRIVDDTVRKLIAEIYRDHPDWRAKEVRAEVCRRLGQDDWPGLSVVQKELAKIRETLLEENPQDKPWNTGTLDSYPITPEALPTVLKVWKLRIDSKKWNWSFTIREAKWAARLSALITDVEELSTRASQYARTEILYELIGRPFDSRGLDSLIMGRFGEEAKDFTDELM